MHSSYFGCFSEPSIEVSLSLHGGCVAAIPSTRSLSVRFACQYLTSVHKIHSCKKQDSESPPCFLWKVIRLSLWPRIWEVANHWHEELLLHGSATWRALNFDHEAFNDSPDFPCYRPTNHIVAYEAICKRPPPCHRWNRYHRFGVGTRQYSATPRKYATSSHHDQQNGWF